MAIRLLDEQTIGKIAAGEVVERPASVVKELLENALDAGARRVAVEIRGGGIELIEVADDGGGMAPEELAVAIRRHATSKLTAFEDLDGLRTLGFRGEALPSIAAVSAFAVRSRRGEDAAGASVAMEYGAEAAVRRVAAPPGTTVTVRDLFGNVPARRKFLRQVGTEAGYVARCVGAYALAYPGVRFSLTTDGRRVFATDGSGDEVAAATAVLGPEVGGEALRLEPLDEAAAVPGVEVSGWVGTPAVTRSHRQAVHLFVNGRWVQSRPLGFALEEAYHSLLMVGRHPVGLVRVGVDPAAVDVNVHPTKAEVKFVDERSVCRAVGRAAHAALAGNPRDRLPEIVFAPSVPAPAQAAIPFVSSRGPLSPERPGEDEALNGGGANGAHASGVPILRVLGQVAGTYIIAEGPEGMYLIDQHAAHERVLYERILGGLEARSVDRQPLLDPLVVDLAPDQLAIFERSMGELTEIGYEIEAFGEGSVVVRAVPAALRGGDPAERLRRILGELAEGGAGTSWLDSVAISAACHTSIRAGQALSLAEMRELVADLERTRQPRACGHGRPTMLHMASTELERQFARR